MANQASGQYQPMTRLRNPGYATKFSMDSILQIYRSSHLQLRLKCKRWHRGAQSRINTLNQYYDATQATPPGLDLQDINPLLNAQGIATETECSRFNDFKRQTESLVFEAQKLGLSAIGAYYGAQMAADPRGTRLEKFRKYWRLANEYRDKRLDGISLTGIAHDPCGPMFVAFAKANGYKGGHAFSEDLSTEKSMRSQAIPVRLQFMLDAGWLSRMKVVRA